MLSLSISSILQFLSCIIQRCSHGWQRWVHWTYPVMKNFTEWFTNYNLQIMGICPGDSVLAIDRPLDKPFEIKTSEKVYRLDNNGRFLKRSLRPNEYPILSNGEPLAPSLVVERLQNEAACMRYIRENTDIPVPRVLDTYEQSGCYFLWMEYIDGIEMSELTKEEQAKVIPQG